METIVVVTSKKDWPHELPGVRVVEARAYLTDKQFIAPCRAKVFNLCRQTSYQSVGYYVSLLAEARGHKPIPSVMTIQDLKSPSIARAVSEDLDQQIQKSLGSIQTSPFILSIYFGQNLAKRHVRLANALFRLFPAPFLKATFVYGERWELQSLTTLSVTNVPEEHQAFAVEAAREYFSKHGRTEKRTISFRFDLAILYEPQDETSPSNLKAIEHISRAAEKMALSTEVIGKEDYGRLAEFDALFIRTTTAVNHYTYRFSRKAAAEGLVVVDDPHSILLCTNKVYLAELLERRGISAPKTWVIQKDTLEEAAAHLSYPCIIKRPDSSSSLGVFKIDDREALEKNARDLFADSELLILQEFLPTEFDWRIAVLDRRPFFAVKYYMAPKHWQIINHQAHNKSSQYGNFESVPVEEVPEGGIKLAVKAANLIGDGLYGVDLKQVGRKWYVIEINDNPNIDHGIETKFLGEELYRRLLGFFLRRIEAKKNGALF
jgi:glutathione synthase/RimK-type ligase-like ATP-grasp enzyme